MTSAPLAADYRTARARFLGAAADRGVAVDSLVHPLHGPDGEELAIDVAWLGARDARDRIVVVSGTHGIEGFAGSMCQSRWLDSSSGASGASPASLPDGVAVALFHAFNPYGFAWQRRVDENNVDVNRNFADFADPPANDDYDDIADALAPDTWSDESQERANDTIVRWAVEHGWERLPGAISRGQYRHPGGIFYGGTEPVWAHRTLREWATRHLTDAARVVLLDLHTGLGEWGEVELISHEEPDSEAYRRSVQWWGDKVASTENGESNSESLHGEWMPAVQRWLSSSEVTGTALEWGTIDAIQVVTALRADNWLHRYGNPTGPGAPPIKAQMRAAFAPGDAKWCEGVWRDFDHYLARTVEVLSG